MKVPGAAGMNWQLRKNAIVPGRATLWNRHTKFLKTIAELPCLQDGGEGVVYGPGPWVGRLGRTFEIQATALLTSC